MRNMLTIHRRALRVGAVIISTVGALLPAGALAYEITYLGTNFITSGINDEGWVAGTASGQASLFAGRLRTIKPYNSTAYAVNNNGEIVGSFSLPDPVTGVTTTHAFRHRDTVNGPISEDLGSVPNSNYSEAHSINNRGQVVGYARVQVASLPVMKYEDHAFLYNDRMIDLALFDGKDNYAYDINDNGDIVGAFKESDGSSHAFLLSKGVLDKIAPLNGAPSVARAVNKFGHVVGSYTTAGVTHAFLYADGKLTDLGVLSGDTKSDALDINDQGQIVGYSSVVIASGREVRRAFLYDGAMIDLSLSEGALTEARAINNKGEIAGGSYFFAQYGSRYVSTRLSSNPRVTVLEHPKIPWNRTPASEDAFGASIALHGDILVIGAPGEGGGKGAVYVYRFENGWWVEKQRLNASNEGGSDRFGSVLTFDGTTLIIGAPGRNGPTVPNPVHSSGSVLVYTLQNQQWTLRQELVAKDASAGGQFGSAIALQDQTMVISAPQMRSAYVFNRNNEQWAEQQKLIVYRSMSPTNVAPVAINNNVIAVSNNVDSGVEGGNLHIFERLGDQWGLTQSNNIYPDVRSLLFDGSRLAIGSSSAPMFYERVGLDPKAPWVITETFGSIGSSIAISSDLLLFGSRLDFKGISAAGAAYLYERVGPYWVDRKEFTASDAQANMKFGTAVAIFGNTLAVSAANNSVYVYSVCPTTCLDIYAADLTLNVSATADKAPVLGNVTLRITVTNNDTANTANGVTVEVRSPNASYVSGPACSNALGKTVCRVASLGPGASTSLGVTLTAPGATGTVVTEVLVKATGPDPDPANNVQSITTEVTPLGDPSIKITGLTHANADMSVIALMEGDTPSVSFAVSSVAFLPRGNRVVVQLGETVIANQASDAPVDLGNLTAGTYTVTVLVRDAANVDIARDSRSFTVKVLTAGVILNRPQNNGVVECGLNETVLMDYTLQNWLITQGGKHLNVVLGDDGLIRHDNPQAQVQLNLCSLAEREHTVELQLVNDRNEVRRSVAARFTVRRVSPNVVLTVPKEGGRYLRGFDMVYEFVHTTPGTRAQMILNDASPREVDIRSRTLPISAEQLLPEKNRIVLQLFDGDVPLPSVEREFYVQDAVGDALAPNTKSGGGAVGALVLMWIAALLSFRSRWGDGVFRKNTCGEENKICMKKRICAATALFTLSIAGAQAAEYQITDLGDFTPTSINDQGWVAGEGPAKNAVLFAGRIRPLLPGDSIARAMNEAGQIAGTHKYEYKDRNNNTVRATHAFRRLDTPQGPNTQYLDLVPKSNYSEGYSINKSGDVVGYVRVNEEDHAFVYTNDTNQMTALGAFTGISAYAYDINDEGDIVGAFKNAEGTFRAFRYTRQQAAADYFSALNGAPSKAQAINNNGQVVGYYLLASGKQRAFLYENETLIDLGTLPGDTQSGALDINDQGQIVGYSINSNGASMRPFLYENGQMKELSSMLATTGWTLQTATAINNRGEITGTGIGKYQKPDTSAGYVTRAYRLSTITPYSFEYPKLPIAHTPTNGDYFGQSIAINGDTLVVGAPGENNGKGRVYVYRLENGWWREKQKLSAKTPVTGDRFGSALAFDGSTLVVGAPGRSSGTYRSGTVVIFDATLPEWEQIEVPPSDASAMAGYGSAVAVDEGWIVVGHSSNTNNAAAYVLRRDGMSWIEQKIWTRDSSLPGYKAYYGRAVAIEGGTIVVGTQGWCAQGGSGAAFAKPYVFEWSGSDWFELEPLPSGQGHHKVSLAINSKRIAVGKPDLRTVNIYARTKTGMEARWELVDSVKPIDATPDIWNHPGCIPGYLGGDPAKFGSSVALEADRLLVGAPEESAGAVHIYEYKPDWPYWTEHKKLVASGMLPLPPSLQFGRAVALFGNNALVGTSHATGAVYAHALCSSPCPDILSADLAISASGLLSVRAQSTINYRIRITNNDGANTTKNVQVTIDIPSLVEYDSSSAECEKVIDEVVCMITSIKPRSEVFMDVWFTSLPVAGSISTQMRVTAAGPDPTSANNSFDITTTVTGLGPPAVNIKEPAAGSTVSRFEDEAVMLMYTLTSLGLSNGGNTATIELLDRQSGQTVKDVRDTTSLRVDLGRLMAGPYTLKVLVHDNQNRELTQHEVTFEVKVVIPSVNIVYPIPGKPIQCGGTTIIAPRFNVPVMPPGKMLELLVGEQLQMRAEAVSGLTLNLCALPQDQEHILTLRMVDVNNTPAYSTSVKFSVVQARPEIALNVPIDNKTYSRSAFEVLYTAKYYKDNTRVELRINDNAPILLKPDLGAFTPPPEQLIAGENKLSITLYDGDVASPAIERTFNLQDVSANADAPAKSGGGGVLDLLVLGFFGLAIMRRQGAFRGQNLTSITAQLLCPPASPSFRPATYKSRCVDRLPGHLYVHSRPRCSGPVPRRYQCRKYADRFACPGSWPMTPVPPHVSSLRAGAPARTPVNLE